MGSCLVERPEVGSGQVASSGEDGAKDPTYDTALVLAGHADVVCRALLMAPLADQVLGARGFVLRVAGGGALIVGTEAVVADAAFIVGLTGIAKVSVGLAGGSPAFAARGDAAPVGPDLRAHAVEARRAIVEVAVLATEALLAVLRPEA